MSILRQIWYALTLRCPTCGSWEHMRHRASAIPRAWLVDGLAMAPGPDTLYRSVRYDDSMRLHRCDYPVGHPLDCSCDKIDLPTYPCAHCGREGHCPHRCQMVGWCHDCDGPDCGGGCRDDLTCPKRRRVIDTGVHGKTLYPDEWRER